MPYNKGMEPAVKSGTPWHEARVSWRRGDDKFTDQRYSRAHEWRFDGGVSVSASSSPANVREPYSVPSAVDPEEALVAAASSCHMLCFLSIAAREGYTVDSYEDAAYGVIEENAEGRQAFSRITLRPEIMFLESCSPSAPDLAAMHQEAHRACFIANSLCCEVVVAAA